MFSYVQVPDNFDILNDATIKVDDVLFIGSTLWTDFLGNDEMSKRYVQFGLNDYRLIGVDHVKKITPDFIYQEHKMSLAFIEDKVKQTKADKIVIFTHMAPSLKSLNKQHVGNGLDGAYASDLEGFIQANPKIKVWVHGHTHQREDYKVGDTRILANQLGYVGYEHSCNISFDPNASFEI